MRNIHANLQFDATSLQALRGRQELLLHLRNLSLQLAAQLGDGGAARLGRVGAAKLVELAGKEPPNEEGPKAGPGRSPSQSSRALVFFSQIWQNIFV